MKTKQPASNKKQSVTVKDLKTQKNPKGGVFIRGAQPVIVGNRGGGL